MTNLCPRCQKSVSATAIACPHCQLSLKALGHQGIPLHQATSGTVLCDTCLYHKDNSCNYPQRPVAKDCILYVNEDQPPEPYSAPSTKTGLSTQLAQWARDHLAILLLVGLGILSVLIVLSGG